MRSVSRRRFVAWMLAHTSTLGSVGCGTVLHPERRGQPAGTLDWKIVALDGIGLLLFFVPGVIAFAVDFATGTIYLPPKEEVGKRSTPSRERPLVQIHVPEKRLTLGQLAQIVSRKMNKEIKLTPGSYQTEELESIHGYWPTTERLAQS